MRPHRRVSVGAQRRVLRSPTVKGPSCGRNGGRGLSGALAGNNEEVAVLVDPAAVASRKPAVDNGIRGGLRQVPVAFHYVGPADLYLAGCPSRHLGSVFVDHPHLYAIDGSAD